MIHLILPPPVSANVYWRTRVIKGVAMTYVSKEAKEYKAAVATTCREAGIASPIIGRVGVGLVLYPHRPQDWQRRQRNLGASWDDSVRSIDLDNAIKVTLDSLKGIAFVDDVWVRRIMAERAEPDGRARLEISLYAIDMQQPQSAFELEAV